jgi:hypothetical protein
VSTMRAGPNRPAAIAGARFTDQTCQYADAGTSGLSRSQSADGCEPSALGTDRASAWPRARHLWSGAGLMGRIGGRLGKLHAGCSPFAALGMMDGIMGKNHLWRLATRVLGHLHCSRVDDVLRFFHSAPGDARWLPLVSFSAPGSGAVF